MAVIAITILVCTISFYPPGEGYAEEARADRRLSIAFVVMIFAFILAFLTK